GVHQAARHEARRRLRRGLHGPRGQDDGPRRRDRLGLLGHRAGQEGGPRGRGRQGRQDPDRDRRAHARDPLRLTRPSRRALAAHAARARRRFTRTAAWHGGQGPRAGEDERVGEVRVQESSAEGLDAPASAPRGIAGARSRTTVLVADLRAGVSSAIDGTPAWLTGAGAGLQAALLSLVVVVVPVLAAYVAGTAEAQGSDGGWLDAGALGTDFWLLAHGVPLGTSQATVTIIPLGLSALAAFCAFASARRSGTPSRAGLAAALGAYVVAVLAVAALALPRGVEGGPSVARVLVSAVVGALVVGGAGLATGLAVRPDAPPLAAALAPLRRRVPREVWLGAGHGLACVAGTVGLGGIVLVTWVLAGQARVADVVASLGLDALGGVALATAQLAFVPNLVAWAVAWLAGPG